MGEFDGRVIVVTGATGGLGGAVARVFLDAGAIVAGVSRGPAGEVFLEESGSLVALPSVPTFAIETTAGVMASESRPNADAALAACASEMDQDATATGTLPCAGEHEPARSIEEGSTDTWPELRDLTGTSGRAITIVGVSNRKPDERPVGE